MTAPTEPFLPVGFRYGTVYQLNAAGRPNATAAVAYDGIELPGPQAFNLTIPNPRTVPQLGNDRILAIDLLPPQQPYVGEINVSGINFDLDAILTNTKKTVIGTMNVLPYLTDQQGFEPMVGILAYQQGLLKVARTRIWHAYVMPTTRLIPIRSSMTEAPQPGKYYMAPNPSGSYLWGQALTLAVDGATEAGIADLYSAGKPHLAAFKGDGATLIMSFSANFQAALTSSITVFDNGVLVSSGLTLATTGVTFAVAPVTGHDIDILYEVA